MMKSEPFTEEAFQHVCSSSMEPATLAQLYGLDIKIIHWIQMGRIKSFAEVERHNRLRQ